MKEYITKNRASKICLYPIADVPKHIATITHKSSLQAMSFFGSKNTVHLCYLPDTTNIVYDECEKRTYDRRANGINNVLTPDVLDAYISLYGITNVDIFLLHLLFTIVLNYNQNDLEHELPITPVIAVYIPTVLRQCGIPYASPEKKANFMDKCRALGHVYGVFPDDNRVLPFLRNCDAYEDDGLLVIDSPYLVHMLRRLFFCRHQDLEKRKENAEGGKYNPHIPIVESHMKTTMYKERCKYAVEIVAYLCTYYARLGHKKGTVRVETIVKNTNILRQTIDESNDIRYKNRLYKKTFKKAFKLIETQTTLREDYPNMTIDAPPNANLVPTYTEKDMILTISRGTKDKKKKRRKKGAQGTVQNVSATMDNSPNSYEIDNPLVFASDGDDSSAQQCSVSPFAANPGIVVITQDNPIHNSLPF